ncbi:protein ELYS-like [Phalacrocorax aristotelis]|uniref:protein ELYS-like n=1 Tax=Phalacrocorax aristotelis TaxID=126867 RepID=UPI003F4C9202
MRDLAAQVTSSLLQFPEVTIQALGEDELTRGSVLRGRFSRGRDGLAWLACGPQLEVVSAVTGERLSAHRFSGAREQPPTIRVVKEVSWQTGTGLLVGLREAEGSVLCLYDLGTSSVVTAVVLPGRVTAVEPITNPGGASVRPWHLHQALQGFCGVAAVATDVGHLLVVDLGLDDLSCSQRENEPSGLTVVTRAAAGVSQGRATVTRAGRHLCLQLQCSSGTAISTLCYISRSNQLAVGFSDGSLSLWNMKTLQREHHCQLEGGRIPVCAVTFQEPEHDPRNCCYLWAVQSTQESEGDAVSLHLLQLAFADRRRLASGQVMYERLASCVEKYSLDLTGGAFPLRGQGSKTKLLSCQAVEIFPNCIDREGSVDEVISPGTSVSVFSWQVNTRSQGKPSAYLGVFDFDCWYQAQKPGSLRPEESLQDCPYFALWSLDAVTSTTAPNLLLDVVVQECSLSWRVPPSYPQPELCFHPSTYNFDGMCLLSSGVVHVTCSGFRKEDFHERCSLCDEEPIFTQAGSKRNAERASHQAEEHLICGGALGQRALVHSVVANMNVLADLTNKLAVTSLAALYARVVLWFCGSRLLPEGSGDEMRFSRPFYNYPLIRSYYAGHRQKLECLSRRKWDSDCLMVDGMVSQLGDRVEKLWQRDEGGTGKYPPPSLRALLELYLLEGVEESHKHAITIYLLLDIIHSFPNKTEPSVDSFAAAFAIPSGLVKLIQGFWLLDHKDYENSLALLFHPATTKPVSWQHVRILRSLMCQGEHGRALRYMQVMKPPFASSCEERLFLTVLLSNRCMAEAWALLQEDAAQLKEEELLKDMYDICREMGLVRDFLRLPFTDSEQKCLEKFLRIHEILLARHLQRANCMAAARLNQAMNVHLMNDRAPRWRQRAVARNSLSAQHGKTLPRGQRQLAVERAKPYHLPSSGPREGSSSSVVQVSLESKNQLEAAVTNMQLEAGQFLYLPLLTSMSA